MFDIGATELLLIVVVAVIVIGPKDIPLALRTAGRWIGKVRRVSAHFRAGLDTMVREAEMEEMEKKWREQNARIMAEHPGEEVVEGAPPRRRVAEESAPAGAESRVPGEPRDEMEPLEPQARSDEPQLPLNTPPSQQ